MVEGLAKSDSSVRVERSIAFVEERHPERRVEIARAWEDGRYVFLHTRQRLEDREVVTTEFFDTNDEGEIIGHWAVTGAFTGPNPSGRTQVDGPTEIVDLDRTEANKAAVRAMVEDCLFPGAQPARIEAYFADPYLQHNPNIGDGLDVVRRLAQDENPKLVCEEIVLLVGKGNFVAVLCNARWEGTPLVEVDIVRLEHGRIVEHWDNTAPIFENHLI